MARHCIEPGTDKLEGVRVRCDMLRNLLLCEICIIYKTKNRHTQVSLEQRSSDTERRLWVLGQADLSEALIRAFLR